MPPTPRDKAAGTFHVFTRCVYAAPALYRDDVDRLEFLRFLARTTARCGWTCIAYCLMTTHYHLIVEVEDNVLPVAMHALNLAYARAFNLRHGSKGRVQFKPYGALRIRSDGDFLTRYRYVARNPVRAGLVARAEEWQWSSFRTTLCREDATFVDDARVHGLFADLRELDAFVNGSR
jgi:REP element-mobilizing transposase RayT